MNDRFRFKGVANAGLLALLVLAVLAASPLEGATASPPSGDPVLLNEVLASHIGTDDTEYFELFGAPGTSLAGLSVIVVESDAFGPGIIDRRFDFKAFHLLGPNGFFLAGNCAGLPSNYGVTPDAAIFNNYFENSSLTVALVETASLSGGVGSSVTSSEVVLDSVALSDGDAGDTFFFGAPVIGPDGAFFPAGVRRVADGVDTDTTSDWVLSDFGLGSANTPTAGGLNGCEPIELTIPQIQGPGQFSIYQGEVVTTTGVVTAITASGGAMWIQDPAGDDDPATSDGIFVDDRDELSPTPNVGDLIQLTATVEEQQFGEALPLTRLDSPSAASILSSGNPLPAPVALSDLPDADITTGIAFWEPLEGMLVEAQNAPVVAPTNRFGEFVMLTKEDAKPGSGFFPQTQQLLIRSLGSNAVDYNPERVMVDDSTLSEAITALPGDRARQLVGVVDYTFVNYKLQPVRFDIANHRLPSLPASQREGPPGDLTVATYNVANLFDLEDNPDKEDEGSTPSASALETQLNKLALSIEFELELPAIIVLQEIENTAIAQVLGDRVNAAAGTNYMAVSFETSDVRGIEAGFLYDADRVALLDAFQLSGSDVEAAFGPSSPSPGREPIYGRFQVDGEILHIVGNHFKSKSGDDPIFGVDSLTGVPFTRVTEVQRKLQAQVVRDFVNGLFDPDPEAMVIVAGDLNDFQFGEPGEGPDHPLAILAGSGSEVPLHNLINDEEAAERYTFIFDGNSQVLDHILVSPSLMEVLVASDILHFNAGFPAALSEEPGTQLRASDHDVLEARFSLGSRGRGR